MNKSTIFLDRGVQARVEWQVTCKVGCDVEASKSPGKDPMVSHIKLRCVWVIDMRKSSFDIKLMHDRLTSKGIDM